MKLKRVDGLRFVNWDFPRKSIRSYDHCWDVVYVDGRRFKRQKRIFRASYP